MQKYCCDAANAHRINDWLANRGGILIWESLNPSDPGRTWTTPALNEDGTPVQKPNWQCGNTPIRHITDVADVEVVTSKEYKRFHVGVRLGNNGFAQKVTDAGSRKIRAEIEKAREKTGKDAWHEFDYAATEFDPRGKNAVIMVAGETIPLALQCVQP